MTERRNPAIVEANPAEAGGVDVPRSTVPLVVVIVSALMGVVGPLGGFIAGQLILAAHRGHEHAAPPSEQARLLAKSISEALHCVVAGFAVGALGGVAFILSMVVLMHQGKRRQRAQGRPPD